MRCRSGGVMLLLGAFAALPASAAAEPGAPDARFSTRALGATALDLSGDRHPLASGAGDTDYVVSAGSIHAFGKTGPATRFGDHGRVTLSPGLLVVDAKQRLVALSATGGQVRFRRLRRDGSRDLTVPATGRPTTVPGLTKLVGAVPDGSGIVVVAKTGETGAVVVRLGDSGRADPAFGSGGVVALPGLIPAAIAVGGSRIVAAGTRGGHVALASLGSDGSAAPGADPSQHTPADPADTPAGAVGGAVVGSDGAVTVTTSGPSGLRRYRPDGSLDPAFGGGGIVIPGGGADPGWQPIAPLLRQRDGRLIAFPGTPESEGAGATLIQRYTTDGRRDATPGAGIHPDIVAGWGGAFFQIGARQRSDGTVTIVSVAHTDGDCPEGDSGCVPGRDQRQTWVARLVMGTADAVLAKSPAATLTATRLRVRLTCTAAAGDRCRTTATVRASRAATATVLATGSATIARGGTAAVSLPLAAAGRRAAARGRLRGRVLTVARDATGYVATHDAAISAG